MGPALGASVACRPRKIYVFLGNKKSDIRTSQNGGYTNK